jgi:large subunit ribosomal protein L13
MQKATSFKLNIKRNWHLIDAKTQSFGRVASRIAGLLQGKDKAIYSPQTDCGDFVVVVNTKFLKVSHPAKWDKKIYYHYSGYPGGIKDVSLREAVSHDPNDVMRKAIYSMLPKNKLRALRINRLKLFVEEKEGQELYAAMKERLKKAKTAK